MQRYHQMRNLLPARTVHLYTLSPTPTVKQVTSTSRSIIILAKMPPMVRRQRPKAQTRRVVNVLVPPVLKRRPDIRPDHPTILTECVDRSPRLRRRLLMTMGTILDQI